MGFIRKRIRSSKKHAACSRKFKSKQSNNYISQLVPRRIKHVFWRVDTKEVCYLNMFFSTQKRKIVSVLFVPSHAINMKKTDLSIFYPTLTLREYFNWDFRTFFEKRKCYIPYVDPMKNKHWIVRKQEFFQ